MRSPCLLAGGEQANIEVQQSYPARLHCCKVPVQHAPVNQLSAAETGSTGMTVTPSMGMERTSTSLKGSWSGLRRELCLKW